MACFVCESEKECFSLYYHFHVSLIFPHCAYFVKRIELSPCSYFHANLGKFYLKIFSLVFCTLCYADDITEFDHHRPVIIVQTSCEWIVKNLPKILSSCLASF